MPEMHSLLLENIKLNALANVAAYQVGLSDSKGTLPIYELEGANEGLSTLYPGESKTGRKIDIVLKSFDEEFDGFGVTSVDFIKLDIEGGELGALKGLQTVLSKFKPVVMVEINKKTYQAAGYEPTTIFDFFQERNYKPYLISKHGSLVSCSGVPDNANVVFKPV
jgi:FkbM family methyltransferase